MSRDTEIASLFGSMSMIELGERYGVSRQRIHQILKQSGVQTVAPYEDRLQRARERFFRKTQVTETGCWEWTGSRFPTGYGRVNLKIMPGPTIFNAHRAAWMFTHNYPIPDGVHVLHRCDNPPCVRPDHLFLGTPKINHQDAVDKGRKRHDENGKFQIP